MKYVLTEKRVMMAADCPLISKLMHSYQSEAFLYLVMDYCVSDLGKVLDQEKYLSETLAQFYLAEVILAVENLHSIGIVYRNLKAENVGISEDGHIKLTNFGYAKENVTGERDAYSYFANVESFPPEVIRSEGHGKAVDWYMTGALLYHMLTGKKPFKNSVTDQHGRDQKVEVPMYVSAQAKDLILGLLEKDPCLRLGFANGADDLKAHPFFEGIDWEMLQRGKVTIPSVDVRESLVSSWSEDFLVRSSVISEDLVHIKDWDFNFGL